MFHELELPKTYSDKGWYVVAADPNLEIYLHSDGKLHTSTRNQFTNEFDGYFSSYEIALGHRANYYTNHSVSNKQNGSRELIFGDDI